VRLRNLETNRIEQLGEATAKGEFTLIAEPDVPYLVEVADAAGRTIAVGNPLAVETGQVTALVITVYALPAGATWWDTARAVLSAAAGAGITAIEPNPVPDSPSR
jgi:hypothetical protein